MHEQVIQTHTHAKDPTSRIGGVELGCFRLAQIIGQGSYGITYRAEQLGFDRDAVVKIAHAELLGSRDAELVRRRFADELRAATRVEHPNLVTLYTAGQTSDGLPAIAMELVPGEVLEDLLIAYPTGLPLRVLRPAFTQLASALEALHDAGVVHRDLSPRNVIIDVAGDAPRLKMLDFGVAMLRGRPRHTIGAVGTPRYMAPEQLIGRAVTASDVFSLGAILWWALTGQEYRDDTLTIEDLHKATLTSEHVDPRQLAPHLSARVSSLLQRLLSPHEQKRPTAGEFLVEWANVASDLRDPPPRSVDGPPQSFGLGSVPPPSADSLGRLPTYDSLPAVGSSTPVGSSGRKLRVLVVDSNPITQHLIMGCLRRHGCQAQATGDPRDATRSSADAFDLVVLSRHMVEADALDVARYLHEYHPEQWVVLTGAGTMDSTMLDAGVRDLISVPASFERLSEMVDELRGELALRASSQPENAAPIDRAVLDDLYANDPTLMRETIEMFMGQIPECLARITDHHEAGDANGVREECRSLSISAGALGANHLGRLAQAAGELVVDDDLSSVTGFLPEMEREYGLVFRALMDIHTARSRGSR